MKNKNKDRVILFDGTCGLCKAWSSFITSQDKNQAFKLLSIQSKEAEEILNQFPSETNIFKSNTMLYIKNKKFYTQSDAFLQIMDKLGYPWRLICILWIVPSFIRNAIYRCFASNRHRFSRLFRSNFLRDD